MEAHIQKWGNSLGLRIPIQIAKKLHLNEGSAVTINVEKDRIVIQSSKKYDLDTMLNNVTSKNQHILILDDKLQGNEEW